MYEDLVNMVSNDSGTMVILLTPCCSLFMVYIGSTWIKYIYVFKCTLSWLCVPCSLACVTTTNMSANMVHKPDPQAEQRSMNMLNWNLNILPTMKVVRSRTIDLIIQKTKRVPRFQFFQEYWDTSWTKVIYLDDLHYAHT